MSFKLGREFDSSSFTKTNIPDSLIIPINSNQELSDKNKKELLQRHVLSIMAELESFKSIYIADSANRVRKEYENLAKLINQINCKLEKCKLLLKAANCIDITDSSMIQSLLIKPEQEAVDWLTTYIDHRITLYELKFGIGNIKYSEYKKCEASEIENLKNHINSLIDFDKKLVSHYECIRYGNQETYEKLISEKLSIDSDWNQNQKKYKDTIKVYGTKIKFKILIQFSKSIESLYQCYTEQFNQISERFKKFTEILEQDCDIDYCIPPDIYLGDEKGIVKFYIKDSRQEYHYLDDYYSCSSWIIKLPGNELLCCGQRRSMRCAFSRLEYIKYLYIINRKTFEIIKDVPYLKNIERCNGTYYKNFVYLFGNLDKEGNSGFSFNFGTWKWENVLQLPMKFSKCICAPFKRSILLCGFTPSLYKYDIDIGSYSTIDLSLKEDTIKLLFYFIKRAYIIEFGGFIYESEFEDEYKWMMVGEWNISGRISQIYWSASSECGLYFGTSNRYNHEEKESVKFYTFEFRKKKIVKIEN